MTYRKGGPATDPDNLRLYLDQELDQLEAASRAIPIGLTTTVVVPCGVLTFSKGILVDKGTC